MTKLLEDSFDCHVHNDKMYCLGEDGDWSAAARHVAKMAAAVFLLGGLTNIAFGKSITLSLHNLAAYRHHRHSRSQEEE